ncbi:MAG TPA: methylenetetrahydrofolate--tRNA-(uracil(54)-C(5))-methyltransferase (FADH(2)-oxidizing) TrmFO [Myxococcales bacterium]|jgi:methylenetetrahydrofolate--tRNA-(uracil-5-)-methyltransferase
MQEPPITILGAGLAGSEAAWQLASRGVAVRLVEMKPVRRSPAHALDGPAELVCSNSLRSDNPENAVGLLHEELRKAGSLVLRCADATRVPAGDALAVDREKFSQAVAQALESHPLIALVREEATRLPEPPGPAIVATGPLTSDALAAAIAEIAGDRLYFYDAIAPIVAADSIDMNVAFRASRWGKGSGDDYINLPLDKEQYEAFVKALLEGEKVKPREFEEPRYFDGCLPIEVMAERGPRCLSFGPMKPIGLTDPHTGRRPYAVVQLRAEDAAGTAFNLVGFQTRLTWPEQKRVFKTLPGLANVEFLRLGQVHRNTFLNAPKLFAPDLSLKERPHLFFAGQITGVEGYVESTASGLFTALALCARLQGRGFDPPPQGTALGALFGHVTGIAHPPDYDYQPSNVTFGLIPPLDDKVKKSERRTRLLERARTTFASWLEKNPAAPTGPQP